MLIHATSTFLVIAAPPARPEELFHAIGAEPDPHLADEAPPRPRLYLRRGNGAIPDQAYRTLHVNDLGAVRASPLDHAAAGVLFVASLDPEVALDDALAAWALAHTLGARRTLVTVTIDRHQPVDPQSLERLRSTLMRFSRRLEDMEVRFVPLSSGDAEGMPSNIEGFDGSSPTVALDQLVSDSRAPARLLTRGGPADSGHTHALLLEGSIERETEVFVHEHATSSRVTEIRAVGAPAQFTEVSLAQEPMLPIAEGEAMSAAVAPLGEADQFCCNVAWLDADPLLPGRVYRVAIAARQANCQFTALKHRMSLDTARAEPASTLQLGEIGRVNLSVDSPVLHDPVAVSARMSAFVVLDSETGRTVGIGTILFALRRSTNLRWQSLLVDKQLRSNQKRQKPCVLWFTGLSGSGKSTIASLVDKKLVDLGFHTYVLDGDNVRHGLNRDLGFTDADRVENIRRIAEVARLFVDAGLIVLVSFISPFRSERALARDRLGDNEFVEIYVNTPLAVCEQRDPKGLYRKARSGKLRNFTGIDSPYEPPLEPELSLDTVESTAEDLAESITQHLQRMVSR